MSDQNDIKSAAAALGRQGGKSTSEAKAEAARANGKKGGRPRKNLVSDADRGNIYIVSGEGERGHRERYSGAHTDKALRVFLAKERCGGDRWAKAVIVGEDGDEPLPF